MEHNSKFISILSDYGFKLTFADESDTTFLRKALQALIQSNVPIKKVTFLSNEFIGLTENARGGLYDLICEDEKGSTFIVEMQLGLYRNYIQRAKFYAFQRFNTLVAKGKYLFDDLTKIYCIGFLANNIFPHSEQYYHFGTLNNQMGEVLDNQIVHIIIEIDKFEKLESEIETDLDKLVYFMKNQEIIDQINTLPKVLSEDWIEQAMNKLDKSRMDPEQRMHFEMMLARNASILQMREEEKKQATREIEERLRQAKEEVKQVEEEVRQAEEKAKSAQKQAKSAQEKAEIIQQNLVKKLFAKGMDINEIAELTTLSVSEINQILQANK